MIAIKGGVGISPGIAIGTLHIWKTRGADAEKRTVKDAEAEIERYEQARESAKKQLAAMSEDAAKTLGKDKAEVFEVHQMMLDDLDFNDSVYSIIRSESANAEYALQKTAAVFANMFEMMEDEYMRGRAADVRDVTKRVALLLAGASDAPPDTEKGTVLAASELTPGVTARLNRENVLGFITELGSFNCHAAIFARAMRIPAVARLSLPEECEGLTVCVNGDTGEVVIDPDEETLARMKDAQARTAAGSALAESYRGRPAITKSGRRVLLYANIASPKDVQAALEGDAEGVGLFRSEFLYLGRDDFPPEDTQFEAYKSVLSRMDRRSVIVRTLDIGADKQADYFHLNKEDNPALGLRAIRICLTRPEIFITQLRALYRASVYGRLSIMFPMITSVSEVRRAKEICASVRKSLRAERIPFDENVPLGIMVETPAAAVISDQLAREADFFSVGTNDLTQYALAMDRQNAAVEPFCDRHHEAVLRLIRMTADNARAAGIRIGVCGELGADESMLDAFLDMKIDELSMSSGAILNMKAKIIEHA